MRDAIYSWNIVLKIVMYVIINTKPLTAATITKRILFTIILTTTIIEWNNDTGNKINGNITFMFSITDDRNKYTNALR